MHWHVSEIIKFSQVGIMPAFLSKFAPALQGVGLKALWDPPSRSIILWPVSYSSWCHGKLLLATRSYATELCYQPCGCGTTSCAMRWRKSFVQTALPPGCYLTFHPCNLELHMYSCAIGFWPVKYRSLI